MAATQRTYYDVLGLPVTATEQEIGSAYRSLAVKYHPDTSPDAGHSIEEFKNVTEAHEILSDPQKRRRYDEEAGIAHQSKTMHFVTGALDLPVTPEEARHGAIMPVKITTRSPCPGCSGEPECGPVVCRRCNGDGFVVRDAFLRVQIPPQAAEGSKLVCPANDLSRPVAIRIRVRAAW